MDILTLSIIHELLSPVSPIPIEYDHVEVIQCDLGLSISNPLPYENIHEHFTVVESTTEVTHLQNFPMDQERMEVKCLVQHCIEGVDFVFGNMLSSTIPRIFFAPLVHELPPLSLPILLEGDHVEILSPALPLDIFPPPRWWKQFRRNGPSKSLIWAVNTLKEKV